MQTAQYKQPEFVTFQFHYLEDFQSDITQYIEFHEELSEGLFRFSDSIGFIYTYFKGGYHFISQLIDQSNRTLDRWNLSKDYFVHSKIRIEECEPVSDTLFIIPKSEKENIEKLEFTKEKLEEYQYVCIAVRFYKKKKEEQEEEEDSKTL